MMTCSICVKPDLTAARLCAFCRETVCITCRFKFQLSAKPGCCCSQQCLDAHEVKTAVIVNDDPTIQKARCHGCKGRFPEADAIWGFPPNSHDGAEYPFCSDGCKASHC